MPLEAVSVGLLEKKSGPYMFKTMGKDHVIEFADIIAKSLEARCVCAWRVWTNIRS